ncbi:MAG TPA: polysaccharide biosynthesis/export family protein [Candidatus Acidoferrales bacterium]|nr:polysaccharide biosynthesis/export family protein [Candidatus Acidoferrales bacterium]
MTKRTRVLPLGLAVLFLIVRAAAQVPSSKEPDESKAKCSSQVHSTYLLGPDDQLEVSGQELTDYANKPMRIDGDGYIQAPLVGRVHVAGLTVQQAEQVLDKAMSTYIREPQVAVSVLEVHSAPVSVLGAVNTPGVHQVQGHKTLLEMLAQAGGIRPDAGYSIRITRQLEWGCLPLPNAQMDPSGQFSVAEVNVQKIMEAKNPQENIQIFPHDVISVPKAEMVYVIGEVRRSGGFVLGEHQSISVLQALSLAEGLSGTADTRHAKILRLQHDADQREELPVDVKAVLSGKKPDVTLQGDDILFIPGSTGKKAAMRTLEAAIQTGTGLAIWRLP